MYWSQVRVLAGPPNIMIKLRNLNSTNLSLQLYFLIFSAIVIYIERDVYLAPFYFTSQESLPALQTYLSSLATFFINDLAFLTPKSLNFDLEPDAFPSHWSNVFFLIFSPIVKIFGFDYLAGRIFAISLNLLGILIIINNLFKSKNLVIILFPLLIFTPAFKNGLALLYCDSLVFLLFGIFLYLYKNFYAKPIFYIYLLISAISVHYSIIIISFFLFSEFLFKKINKKDFIINIISIFLISVITLIILASFDAHHSLAEKIFTRFSLPTENGELFSLSLSANSLLRRIYLFFDHVRTNFGYVSIFLLFFSFILAFHNKDRLFSYFFAFTCCSIVLAKYTISHNFVSIQYVLAAYFLLIYFIDYIFKKNSFRLKFPIVVLLVISVFFIKINRSIYTEEPELKKAYLIYKNVNLGNVKEENLLELKNHYWFRIYPIDHKLRQMKFYILN